MPLVQKDYYLSSKALELIEKALPKEYSEHNLAEALRNGLRAWILDQKTNQRILIPPEAWWRGSQEENPELYKRSVRFVFSSDLALLSVWCDKGFFPLSTSYKGELQIDKEGLDRLLASAVKSNTQADSYRTGAPGRPTIAHLISDEFNRRLEAGEILSSIAKEAGALRDWARAQHPNAPTPEARTIENQIRSAYNQLKGQEPTK